LPNDFVFDDGPIVGANPAIRTINPIKFLTSPYWATQQYEGIYRPFTIFSLSLDYAIWKRWPAGFRLTNLSLHAVNGFLVFLLCASIVGEGIIPLAAMVIYLAHPVHTEAVTSIVGRSELFATCFFLSAWLLFRRGRTLWPAMLFAMALLSKENAILLPAILLLDFLVSHSPPKLEGVFVRRLAILLVVAGSYLVLRFSVLGGLGIPASAQYLGGRLSYTERFMTSGRVFLENLRLVFAPINIAGDYDFNAIPVANLGNWDAWVGLLLIATIVLSAVLWWRRNWIVSLGILFAFLVYLPTSNWIMPISVLMAERFLYLPLVGLSLAVAAVFSRIRDYRLRRWIGLGFLVPAILLCISHNYTRRNDFTFFANMVRIEPDSAKARLGYGFALLGAGFKDDAARQLEAGLRILPDYPALLTTLALTRTTTTDCTDAWPLLKRALEVDPSHGDTRRRMADCYFKEGKIQEAESMYRQALNSIPFPDSLLYLMWGRSLEETGQTQTAITAYEHAALIDPNNVFIKQKLNALGVQ
jgi:protein O-mannosyl-transferase